MSCAVPETACIGRNFVSKNDASVCNLTEFKLKVNKVNVELFEESLEYFNECNFDITFITRDLHNSEKNEGNIVTEHENMFTQQGIKIKHLVAVKK